MSNLSFNTPAANLLTSNLEKLRGGKLAAYNAGLCSRLAFYITSKAILDAMRLYSLSLLQQEYELNEILASPRDSVSSALSDLCEDVVKSLLCSVLDKIARDQHSIDRAKVLVKRLSNESIFSECRWWLFALRDPLRGMKLKSNGCLSEEMIFSDCLEWFFAEGDTVKAQLPQKQLSEGRQKIDEELLSQEKAQPPQEQQIMKQSEMTKIKLALGKLADEETRLAGNAPNNFLASSSTSLASSDYDVKVDATLAANREWNNVQLSQTWASTSQEDAKPKKKKSKLGRLFSCMFCCFRRKSKRARYSQ